jgi:hypothetical protein
MEMPLSELLWLEDQAADIAKQRKKEVEKNRGK